MAIRDFRRLETKKSVRELALAYYYYETRYYGYRQGVRYYGEK